MAPGVHQHEAPGAVQLAQQLQSQGASVHQPRVGRQGDPALGYFPAEPFDDADARPIVAQQDVANADRDQGATGGAHPACSCSTRARRSRPPSRDSATSSRVGNL